MSETMKVHEKKITDTVHCKLSKPLFVPRFNDLKNGRGGMFIVLVI